MFQANRGRVRGSAIHCLLCVVVLASVPFAGRADTKDRAPRAPLPAELASAKTVFIANAPGDILPKILGTSDRTYNEFYAAMRKSGVYRLVSSPADADLIFEVSFTSSLSGVSGNSATGTSSSTSYTVKLTILDAKTRVPLWWFAEPIAIRGSFLHPVEDANTAYLRAITSLADDVKKLSSTP